jgi:hypothetical protein
LASLQRPPMSLSETKLAVLRTLGASKCLIERGYCLQGIARAYYAVYLASVFLSRSKGLWPTRPDGRPADKLHHSDMPGIVASLYGTISAPVSFPASVAENHTDKLYTQRVVADYYGHTEATESAAKSLHVFAKQIAMDLLDEAARTSNPLSPPIQTPTQAGGTNPPSPSV